MKSVQIGSKFIGDKFPCYVVAEIGNLFKNFDEAKRLIDSALEMKIDAIKFQTWDAETLTTKKNLFDLEVTGNVSQYEFHKNIQISQELQFNILEYARKKNLTIFSAPSHMNDIDLMEKMDLPAFKIGSDLACHIPLLKRVAKFQKPIILSTGMCSMDEVKKSVNTIFNEGNEKLILLHCISDYPTKIEESNLNAIIEMKKEFSIPIGFSDHSVGSLVSLSAATMGSNIIEKHLKHPQNSTSPDDVHALTPEQFSKLIQSIRLVELSKGSGKKIPSLSEQKNLVTNRVSIIAMQEIKKGNKITSDMIDIRRPGSGIMPYYYKDVLLKKAKLNISKETPLTWEMLE